MRGTFNYAAFYSVLTGHCATKLAFLSIILHLVFSASSSYSAFALSSPEIPSVILYILKRPFSSYVKIMPLSYFSQYSHNNFNLRDH